MWRILVVDDDDNERELFAQILQGKAKCDLAKNGREAISAYNLSIREKKSYDLILLDIMLPDMSGIEVLDSIREKEKRVGVVKQRKIPVIMVTAKAEKDVVLEACRKGCNDYMIKPVDNHILLEKIEKTLKKKL
ncbi:MAG: response regulator [Candidatus Aureabacteria bacterium]|nr:response regulator [Candidatus Auribacterota bacterium]